jgi:DNA ligase (NAD+)
MVSEPNPKGIVIEASVKKMVEARQAYYNTGHPIMTDQEYDALEEMVRQFDPNHPIFEKIGSEPSSAWAEATHSVSMGSLDKAHTEEDILKWAKKFPGSIFSLQIKLDGLSVSIDYEQGIFKRGITRGDGIKGEDISPNIKKMKFFLPALPGQSLTASVRAEIMLSHEDFDRINETLPEGKKYSNPRSAAAGISRRLDGAYCKYLNLTYYDITEPLDEDRKLHRLSELGFFVPINFIGTIDYIVNEFNAFKHKRASLPFNIDGMVVKVCDQNIQKSMGMSKNRPRAQRAWKFDPPSSATVLSNVTWEVGRTGVVTPLGHVEPVVIDGSTIKKVTLHNVAEIARLGIGIGDTIVLSKRGDIIPKIESVIEHKGSPIEIPRNCPSCGSELKNDEIRLMCLSDECPRKNFTRILNWIKVVEIDQFGESLAEELSQQGKLKGIADIYRLQKEDISSIEGWGELSAETIIANIEKSKSLPAEKLLTAVGIPGISVSTSEELLKQYGSVPALFNVTVEQLVTVKGFSDISANSVVLGLQKYRSEIQALLQMVSLEIAEKKTEGLLAGQSFCFTGEMSQPRTYFQGLVVKHGGKNISSVTKDLTYLVCNENKGSSKSQKAEKYGVKVINENTFLGMIGESSHTVTPEKKIEPKIESYSLFE